MAGHGNFGVDDAANQVGAFLSAFDLHHFGASFFHEAGCIAHCIVRADVVGAVGHIGHKQRVLHATPHGLGVVKHFVHRDRERVRVAEHGHGQRVADQNNVDGSLVHQARAGIVVGGQAGDGLMLKFLLAKGSDSNLSARFANRCETHDVLQCPSALADRARTHLGCCWSYCRPESGRFVDGG